MYIYTQTVNRWFCYCCYSGNLSAYVGHSNSEIYWLTAEFRHQGIPSATSKKSLLAAALLLFSTDTITYALDLLVVGIKLGLFNADSGAVSLQEQLWAPNIIFIQINVSYTLCHGKLYVNLVSIDCRLTDLKKTEYIIPILNTDDLSRSFFLSL